MVYGVTDDAQVSKEETQPNRRVSLLQILSKIWRVAKERNAKKLWL